MRGLIVSFGITIMIFGCGCQHLVYPVASLLKMAGLDAGIITLEPSPENLSELLECIGRQYSFLAEKEGKEIEWKGNAQTVLLCDRVWFEEAVGNLIKEALDHTRPGERILVRWRQSPCLTQITIENTGNGIYAEDVYHKFKGFYQSRFSGNTCGLGVSLAKSIIEAHQGSMEVHSQSGQRTVFTITIPYMTNLTTTLDLGGRPI